MKIALVIEKMKPSRGGREVSTAQIAARLAGLGHDVTVICQAGSWDDDTVRLLRLGRRGVFRFRAISAFADDVARAIKDGQYDIVHAMLPVIGANVYQPRGGTIPGQIAGSVRRWKRAGGIRKVVFEPMNLPRRRLGQIERRLVANPTVRCLAVSQMVADEFASHYGRREGVSVIYNGVDLPHVEPDDWQHWRQKHRYEMGLGPRSTVFIIVATNFALKGVDEAIRAFARWISRRGLEIDDRLVIVGRHLTERYHRTAGLLGAGRYVIFVPPTDEIQQWYAAADACVLLSWYDPCSRTVLEAIRCGLPAVTTKYNGAAEILGQAGIVVDSPSDTRAVIEAFEQLSDFRRRADLRRQCLALAGSVSMERHVEQLVKTYEEILSS